MRSWCRIFVAWMAMCISPFYGDIFSASAQMTVKTGLPLITWAIGIT